ncbi:MAG: hypothetical protein ABEJ03_00160 [Candidatus Nanohaloarchaea archaeon]
MATIENSSGEAGAPGPALKVDDETWRRIVETIHGLIYSFEGEPSSHIYELPALRGGELGVFDPDKAEYDEALVDTGERLAGLQPADTGFADFSEPLTALAKSLYDGGGSYDLEEEYQTGWHKVKAELRDYDACSEDEPGDSLRQFVQEFQERYLSE